MAETSQENVKEKVQAVREVVLGKSNNEVVMVLQYYEYSVERAIQAYLEDGAKEALQEWNFTGTKPNKKRKNKKKASGDKQSSSSPSDAANDKGATSVNGKSGLPNGDIPHGVHRSETETPTDASKALPSASIEDAVTSVTTMSSAPRARGSGVSKGSKEHVADSSQRSAAPAHPQRHPHGKAKGHGDSHQHDHRERTISEVSTGSGMGDGHHKRPLQGLEKAFKDLQRQTTSLERLRLVLDNEIERSYKSVKNVFEELRTGLSDREAQIMQEMDMLKKEASEMLELRQNKAAEFKRQVERADRMKEAEVTELRTEIKHFVSDRRHDEELGRTTRFQYDSDLLLGEIQKFGEVIHVKPINNARRPSTSSVTSSVLSHDGVDNHEDLAQSPEVAELQDRLKNSLKIQDSSHRGATHTDHLGDVHNDSSHAKLTNNKGFSRQRPNDEAGIQHSSNEARQSQNGNTTRDATSSPSPSSPKEATPLSPKPQRNQNSRGRGRGRGGGRGGGRGQGYGNSGDRVYSARNDHPRSSPNTGRPVSSRDNAPRGRETASAGAATN